MRIAVPCEGREICAHFGHAPEFIFFDADPQTAKITGEETVSAPPHEPGLLPQWLADRGANAVLAGGMGGRARELFSQHGIEVVTGVRESNAKRAVELHLEGRLTTQANPCDHDTRPATDCRRHG